MKSALLFAVGALGLLAIANLKKSRARRESLEQPAEEWRKPRARRMRLRHRNAEGLLDLNSATLVELRALTGIDDESAERILENRPYLTKLDLVGRRVIPDATYSAIKQFITVVHAA